MESKTRNPQAITSTNLFTLRKTFETSERVSNRIPPTFYSHLKRCLNAGLLINDADELVLTDAGRTALGR